MFHFKQFDIEDHGATLKVGTDALLLGALAEPSVIPRSILDIGTGCGILALMMAQRFPSATIDAIDIDQPSVSLAENNFSRSPWHNRLRCYKTSLQEMASHPSYPFKGICNPRHLFKGICNPRHPYDLIISNPPYFSNSLRNDDAQKRLARHDDALPPTLLFSLSSQLLSPSGIMWISCPASEQKKFITAANNAGFNVERSIGICTSYSKPPRLNILSFSHGSPFSQDPLELGSPAKAHSSPLRLAKDTFFLRDQQNQYTAWYRKTTEPFLL